MHAASNSITLFNAVDQRYPLLDNARKNAACSRGEVAAGFEARVSRSARQTRWKLKVSRAVLAGAIKSSLDDLSRVIARSCGETARERESSRVVIGSRVRHERRAAILVETLIVRLDLSQLAGSYEKEERRAGTRPTRQLSLAGNQRRVPRLRNSPARFRWTPGRRSRRAETTPESVGNRDADYAGREAP